MSAYSFVLARAQERQADEYAVELAGRDITAVMLARLDVKQRNLAEDFWPSFFRQSKEQPKTPRDPFEQMLNGAGKPIGPVNAQKWFFEALQVPRLQIAWRRSVIQKRVPRLRVCSML